MNDSARKSVPKSAGMGFPQRADQGVDQLLQFFMGDLGLGHDQLAAFEVQAAGVGQFDPCAWCG